MGRTLRITIVDDQALTDPFYSELLTRLRQELRIEPTLSWIDAEKVLPAGKFLPRETLAELRGTDPDVIILDVVLHEAQGRHDLILSDWLTKEIRRDPVLRRTALVYVSKFFGDHYPIPERWRAWCFSKQHLLSDEVAWNSFKKTLTNPRATGAAQTRLRRMTKALISRPRR